MKIFLIVYASTSFGTMLGWVMCALFSAGARADRQMEMDYRQQVGLK